jgi:phosphatidylglycerophosphate synthase
MRIKYKYKDISSSFKNGGSIISVLFMNRISMPFIFIIANYTRITPNQITLIGFLFGLYAALLFYNENYILGVILFEISYLFDCIDGRLARLTNNTSKIGDMYDHFLGQLLILILTIPFAIHFYLLNMQLQFLFLIMFVFLSPFNYFVNYYSKYTFRKTHAVSLISENKSSQRNIIISMHLFMKKKGMKSIPSDVEAIHLVFLILPIFLYYKYDYIVLGILILAILVFLLDIAVTVYRNIKLDKID